MSKLILEPRAYKNPIIFFANGIGDHILVLPAIRALSKIFNGKVSLMALPNAHSEIFSDITFDAILPIIFTNGIHSDWKVGVPKDDCVSFNYEYLIRSAKECDLFISLTPWYTSEIKYLINQLNPITCIGPRADLFNIDLNYDLNNFFDIAFSSAHLFEPNLILEDFSQPPAIFELENINIVNNLKKSLDGNTRLLIVHADTKKRKMIDSSTLLKAIDKFLETNEEYLVIVVGLNNQLQIDSALNRDRIYNLCGLSLDLTFGIIGISDIFIGIDSCMLHVADLYRIPCVGIFGPTDPQKWGLRFTVHEYLFAEKISQTNKNYIVDLINQLKK
jgi:hypothetical protein